MDRLEYEVKNDDRIKWQEMRGLLVICTTQHERHLIKFPLDVFFFSFFPFLFKQYEKLEAMFAEAQSNAGKAMAVENFDNHLLIVTYDHVLSASWQMTTCVQLQDDCKRTPVIILSSGEYQVFPSLTRRVNVASPRNSM